MDINDLRLSKIDSSIISKGYVHSTQGNILVDEGVIDKYLLEGKNAIKDSMQSIQKNIDEFRRTQFT